MNSLRKIIKYLLWVNIILAIAGYLILSLANLRIYYTDMLLLLLIFSIVAYVLVYIFIKGQTKDPRSQTFYTLGAVSLKMLLDLFIALIWFAIAKKNSLPSVFIFFVLYLTLTLITTFFILNQLKKKLL